MANDGRINIIITEGDIGSGGGSGDSPDGEGTSKSKKDEKSKLNIFWKAAGHRLLHAVESEAKKMIHYGVSTYGMRTGDYLTQHNLQVSLGILEKTTNIALTGLVGLKVAGPIGAAIGVGVSTITFVTSSALEWNQHLMKIRLMNRDIDILRKRSGIDTLDNGSRGTEN